VIGIIIVLIGVVGAYLVSYGFKFTSGEPTNNVPTKTSTSSAKQATPAAQKDETADWKVFTGDAFLPGESGSTKVSFKYPEDYNVSRDEYSRIFLKNFPAGWGPQNSGEMALYIGILESEESVDSIIKGYNGSSSSLSLGGKKAQRFTHTTSSDKTVNYLVRDIGKNNWGFEFRCVFMPVDSKSLSGLCDQMASTFKFLD
ncbi:MAG: hypothetical protein Q8O75_02920, partial [bacterium]|nr:hypothetical protein [bacterium]